MYKDNNAAEEEEKDEARAAVYFLSTAANVSDLTDADAALRINIIN